MLPILNLDEFWRPLKYDAVIGSQVGQGGAVSSYWLRLSLGNSLYHCVCFLRHINFSNRFLASSALSRYCQLLKDFGCIFHNVSHRASLHWDHKKAKIYQSQQRRNLWRSFQVIWSCCLEKEVSGNNPILSAEYENVLKAPPLWMRPSAPKATVSGPLSIRTPSRSLAIELWKNIDC